MSGNNAFKIIEQTGWQAGINNMLRAEFRSWFATRTWWVQSLVWIGVVDLILVMVLSASSTAGEQAIPFNEMVMLYGVFGGMFTTVGVIIKMQGAVIGEKISGTAAWVLSKPMSRTAFILSKLIGNAVGVAVTAALIPGILAYLIITLGTGESLSPLRFLGGIGALYLFALYFLAFTLMLGAFFNNRGPVIGIALGLVLGQQFILGIMMSISPILANLLPFQIVMPPQDSASSSLAGHIILGTAPPSWVPVYASIVSIFLFVAAAIWRFRREEL